MPWSRFVLALWFLADPILGLIKIEPPLRQSLIGATSVIHPIFQRILTPKKPNSAKPREGGYKHFSTAEFKAMLILYQRENLRSRILQIDKRQAWSEPTKARDRAFVLVLLLEMSGKLMAKEPHDKIYGIYTILQRFVSDLPPVDYNKPVWHVYEEVTRHIIRSTHSIAVVMHLPYTARQADTPLPLWVPDYGAVYSATHIPAPTRFRLVHESNYAPVHVPTLEASRDGELNLRGIVASSIAARSATFHSQNDIAKVAYSILLWYQFAASELLPLVAKDGGPGDLLKYIIRKQAEYWTDQNGLLLHMVQTWLENGVVDFHSG